MSYVMLISDWSSDVCSSDLITSSLSQSAARAGLSHSLAMDMASVFGYDIDFAQDIRQGDEFDVIYEQKMVNGKSVGNGPILSARFTNRGKTYTAVRRSEERRVGKECVSTCRNRR